MEKEGDSSGASWRRRRNGRRWRMRSGMFGLGPAVGRVTEETSRGVVRGPGAVVTGLVRGVSGG